MIAHSTPALSYFRSFDGVIDGGSRESVPNIYLGTLIQSYTVSAGEFKGSYIYEMEASMHRIQ